MKGATYIVPIPNLGCNFIFHLHPVYLTKVYSHQKSWVIFVGAYTHNTIKGINNQRLCTKAHL